MSAHHTTLVALLLLLPAALACGGSESAEPLLPDDPFPEGPETPQVADTTTPTGLALPVAADQIIVGAIVNPFGVVRSSLDRAEIGHRGIDLAMPIGAPIFAVADGLIVSVVVHPDFASVWSVVDFNDGMLPFKELLNLARFPSGPLMCYPKGTDVRVAA